MALEGTLSEGHKQPEPQNITLKMLPSLGKVDVLRYEALLVCGRLQADVWVLLGSAELRPQELLADKQRYLAV